ncbi:hypothetical protein [Streptomyces sp. NPDC057748]|uniref:hypothetical protein n=1 Tax=unclassified Streptomyces TaxID=2593676 RepID=UPI00369BB71B
MMRRSRKERARWSDADAVADQELEEQGGWWMSPSTGSVVVTGVVRRLPHLSPRHARPRTNMTKPY